MKCQWCSETIKTVRFLYGRAVCPLCGAGYTDTEDEKSWNNRPKGEPLMAKGDKRKAVQEYAQQRNVFEFFEGNGLDELYAKYDAYQREMDESFSKVPIVIADEKSGTGKTTIAVRKAFQLLKEGKIDKIQYVRFPDDRNGSLGFLPGDLNDAGKLMPFTRPFFDACAECGLQREAVYLMVTKGIIELGTDIGWRGGNMTGTFLIVDEGQNGGKISDLHLILTRIHEHRCYTALIGDSNQNDNVKVKRYGVRKLIPFQVWQYHLLKRPDISVKVTLPKNYRGKVSQYADRIWETVKELENELL